MGGLRKERFGRGGRGEISERDRGVVTVYSNGSETGLVTKMQGNNIDDWSVTVSSEIKSRATTSTIEEKRVLLR